MQHVPIEWDGVQLNDRYASAPHRDKGNDGDSFTVTFGDFTGGELLLHDFDGDIAIDTRHKSYLFNGSQITHSTAPFEGRRYCLVFYRIVWPPQFGPRYAVVTRVMAEGLRVWDEYDGSVVVYDRKGKIVRVEKEPHPLAVYVGKIERPGQSPYRVIANLTNMSNAEPTE